EREHINVQGKRLVRSPRSGRRLANGSLRISPNEHSEQRFERFLYYMGDYNPSSISIRKDVIERFLPFISRITDAPDFFIFLSALASNGSLIADSRALTEYRVHANTSNPLGGAGEEQNPRVIHATPNASLIRLRQQISRWLASTEVGVEMVKGTRAERLARYRRVRALFEHYLIDSQV